MSRRLALHSLILAQSVGPQCSIQQVLRILVRWRFFLGRPLLRASHASVCDRVVCVVWHGVAYRGVCKALGPKARRTVGLWEGEAQDWRVGTHRTGAG